jgi:hypothetical protein
MSLPAGRPAAGGLDTPRYPLPAPYAAEVRVRGDGRAGAATVHALSPRSGELTAPALRGAVRAGSVLDLTLPATWLGRLRLTGLVTGVRGEVVVVGFHDRESVRRSSAVLVGEVESFRFRELEAAGVRSRHLDRFLTVATVTGDEPLTEALDLRLLANQHFGRLLGLESSETLADRFDAVSVNLVCRLGRKAVGTGRIVFNGGDRSLSELEEESGGLPEHLWRDGFVEASRVAVHPCYRGHGVFCALARVIGAVTLGAGVRYIVMDSIDKLLPLYRRIGAEPLGITKKHQWSDELEHVLAIDLCRGVGRFDRNALYWQVVFGPVVRDPPPYARELARRVPLGPAVLGAKSWLGRLQSQRSRTEF